MIGKSFLKQSLIMREAFCFQFLEEKGDKEEYSEPYFFVFKVSGV